MNLFWDVLYSLLFDFLCNKSSTNLSSGVLAVLSSAILAELSTARKWWLAGRGASSSATRMSFMH